MGFGFNFLFTLILVPLTGILLFSWFLNGQKILLKLIAFIWSIVLGLIIFVKIAEWFSQKITLKKGDFYGDYVIDRSKFTGKQADWQYENFRFTIKENDSIYFYVTEKQKILSIYKGTIETTNINPKLSQRLRLKMTPITHHVVSDNPTIYRSKHNFYLVFCSPIFKNVFFKKGIWKPIDN